MDRKIGILTVRELLGIAMLVILLLSGLLTAWYMDRVHSGICAQLRDSSWLALSGQWEKARDGAAAAREEWNNLWNFLAAFSNHNPMQEIDGLFEELTVCAGAGLRTEFARICATLASQVESLGDSQKLSWWNIL